MNKLFLIGIVAALAGCVTSEKDAFDMRSEASAEKAAPTAVEWQNEHDACMAAAMRPEALAVHLKTPAAADAILSQVKGAYATEPMAAMQIGAITQLVMCPKCDKAAAGRIIWKDALLRAAESSKDSYRTMFFLDQLRWCGTADQKSRIAALGKQAKEKCVKDFAEWVAREL